MAAVAAMDFLNCQSPAWTHTFPSAVASRIYHCEPFLKFSYLKSRAFPKNSAVINPFTRSLPSEKIDSYHWRGEFDSEIRSHQNRHSHKIITFLFSNEPLYLFLKVISFPKVVLSPSTSPPWHCFNLTSYLPQPKRHLPYPKPVPFLLWIHPQLPPSAIP